MSTHPILSVAEVLMSFSLMEMTHEERSVQGNGFDFTQAEIQFMDHLPCGPIPNDRYWLNYLTGMWGEWEQAPAQSHISQPCVPESDASEEDLSTDQSWVTTADLCHECDQRLT